MRAPNSPIRRTERAASDSTATRLRCPAMPRTKRPRTDEPSPGPIVNIPPPPPEIRDAVARQLLQIVARQALREVGLLPPLDDTSETTRARRPAIVKVVPLTARASRSLSRLQATVERATWARVGIDREGSVTEEAIVEEALAMMVRQVRFPRGRRSRGEVG